MAPEILKKFCWAMILVISVDFLTIGSGNDSLLVVRNLSLFPNSRLTVRHIRHLGKINYAMPVRAA